jgi:hypothetical protein
VQYKQAVRIMLEIVKTPNVPTEIALAVIRLFCKLDAPPRLGPYRKRSVEQMLWSVASDSTHSPEVRWRALRKLLVNSTPKSSRNEIQPAGV